MRRLVTWAIVLILIGASFAYFGFTEYQSTGTAPNGGTPLSVPVGENLTAAVNYLVGRYNRTLGLIPETNGSVYWLYSDNYLAALALSRYGASNATVSEIAYNISQTVSRYLPAGAVNQYTVLVSGGPCSFSAAGQYDVTTIGTAQVRTVINNGTGTLDPSSYADIAFLDAICLSANPTQALQAYAIGRSMFNGAGFVDLPFTDPSSSSYGQYQTYKLALFLYASTRLGQPTSGTAFSLLLEMQAKDGGFYTGYYEGYSHGRTTTNTETTSLALLALEGIKDSSPAS